MLFLNGGLFAQSFLGIYGGAYIGNFSGDSPENSKYSSQVGYMIGLNYDIPIKEDVYISLLPAYVNSGAKLNFLDSTGENYQDSIKFSYQAIIFPVEMKIISDNKRFQFTGGLELVFPLHFYGETEKDQVELKEDLNEVGVDVLFGIGYRIPINKNLLILDLSYSQGLLNIAENLDQNNSYLPRVKTSSIRLTAAWNITLGKNSK